jgi:Family of unknown function (DUF5636)
MTADMQDNEMNMMSTLLSYTDQFDIIESSHKIQSKYQSFITKLYYSNAYSSFNSLDKITPYNDHNKSFSQTPKSSYISDPYNKSYYRSKDIIFTGFYENTTSRLSSRPALTDPDMIAVQNLLMDWNTLEAIFIRFADEFAAFARNYAAQQLKMFGEQAKLHHKLFTTFCKEWTKKHGFNDFVKLRDGLSEKQFGEQLKALNLFDDIAFRQTPHGSIAHFMQWVAIISHYENTKFTQKTPAQLYAALGQEELIGSRDNNWLYVFEFGAGGSTVFDMHRFITSANFQKKAPILSSLIIDRDNKSKKVKKGF